MQQHYIKLEENAKNRKLNDLLDQLEFNQVRYAELHVSCYILSPHLQVVIFVKSLTRANELDKLLREYNFPSICIHSGLAQDER